jgi:guanylate kinase
MFGILLCLAGQPGVFDHVVVNETVDNAYTQLRGIVIQDVKKLQDQKKE